MEYKFPTVIVDCTCSSSITSFSFINSYTETDKPQLAIKQLVTGYLAAAA